MVCVGLLYLSLMGWVCGLWLLILIDNKVCEVRFVVVVVLRGCCFEGLDSGC